VCYLIMPKAIKVLLGFTPEDIGNLVFYSDYLSIFIRLILVFGLAFELPVFLVLLNLTGLVSARRMLGWWRGLVFGIFVFAAVATPTGDPFTMLVLATPMLGLLVIAYVICFLHDRRRRRRQDTTEPDYDNLDDDEASPLDTRPSDLDDYTYAAG
jgi:sec-independent protein translocase protein TatC